MEVRNEQSPSRDDHDQLSYGWPLTININEDYIENHETKDSAASTIKFSAGIKNNNTKQSDYYNIISKKSPHDKVFLYHQEL